MIRDLTVNWAKGIERVWKEDSAFQEVALKAVLEEIRGVNNEELLDRDFNLMKEEGMFYVPNDEYMKEYFGGSVTEPGLGVYDRTGEYCMLYKRLVLPLRTLEGKVLGLCGYSNGNDEDERNFVKYLYPPKRVWNKDRWMYTTGEQFKKAIEEGYVFIVDGLFDQLRLRAEGYNAVSLGGTLLTDWHKIYLGFVKYKIVLPDNDDAGNRLVRECKRHLTNVTEWKQGKEWDIDDLLKSEEGRVMFNQVFEKASRNNFMIDYKIR